MFNINLSNSYFLNNVSGVQPKLFFDNFYYKIDNLGPEGIAEELSSLVLNYSNLKQEEFVEYEYGKINNFNGCKSKNFLKSNDERFATLDELHVFKFNKKLEHYVRNKNMEEKINYTVQFVKNVTGLDITDYLRKCITLDYIVRNTDRHFSNLGIIICKDGTYKPAPIFDNGAALMSTMSIMPTKSIDKNLD